MLDGHTPGACPRLRSDRAASCLAPDSLRLPRSWPRGPGHSSWLGGSESGKHT